MKQKWSVINRKPNYKVETKNLTSKNFEWQRDSTGIKSSDLRKKKEKRRQFRKQNAKNRFYGNNSLNSGSTILFENGRVVSSKRKREFSGSSYDHTQNHSPSHCFDSELTCHPHYVSFQQKASKKSKFSDTDSFSSELKRHRLTIPSIDIYKREKGDLVSKFLGENRVCSDSDDEFTSDFTYNREIDDLYFDTQSGCHSNKTRAKVEADFERQFRDIGLVTKQVNQSSERLIGSGVGGAGRGVTCASSANYVLQSPRIVQLKSDVRKYNKKSVSSVKGMNVSKFESLSISVDLNNASTGRQISDSPENMNRKSRKRLRQISGSSYNRRDTSSDSDSSINSSESSFSSASSGIRKKARHKSERSDESSDCKSTCSDNSSNSSRAGSLYSHRNISSSSRFTSGRNGKSIVRSGNKSSRSISSSCISSRDNDKYSDSYSSDSSSSSYMSRSSGMENNGKSSFEKAKALSSKQKIGISSDLKTATAGCAKQTDHQKRKLSKRRKSSASENKISAMKTELEGSESTDDNSSGSNLSQYKLHPKRRKSSSSEHTRSSNKMANESSDSCHSDISESRLSQYKLHSSSSSSSQSSSSSSSASSSSDIDSETKDVTNLLNRINDYHKSLSGYKCLLDKTENKQESDSKLPDIVASNSSRQISSCAKENVVCDVNRIKKVEVNKENKQVGEDQSVKWCNEFLERYKCLAKNTDDAHEKFEFSQDAKLSKTDEAAEVENCTETKSAEMTKDEAVSSAPVSQKSQFGNTYSYFVQGSSDSDTDSRDFTDSDMYKDDVTEPSTTAVGTGSSSLSGYLFSGQTKQTAADIESCDKDGNVENACNDEKPTEVTSNEYHTDTETDVEDELPLRNFPRLRLDIENTALPVFTSVLSRSNPKDTCVPATTSALSESNSEDVSAAISTQKPSTCIPILYRQKLCGYSSSENELDDNKTDTESQAEVEINTFEEENSNTGNLKENKAFETIPSLPETKEDSCVNRNMLKNNNGSVKNLKEKPRIYDFYVYSESDSEDEQLSTEVQNDCSSNEKQQELITTINTDNRNSDPLEVKSKRPNSSLEVQGKTADNTLEVKDKTLDDPLEIELKKFYLLLQSEQNLDNVRNSDSRNSEGVEKLVTKVKTDITSNEAEEFSTKVKLDDGTSFDGKSVTNDKTDNTSYKGENPVTSYHNTKIKERPKHEVFTRLKEKKSGDPLEVKGKTPNSPVELQGRTTDNTLDVKDRTSNTQLDVQSRPTAIAYEVEGEMPNKPLEVQGKNTDNALEVKDKSSNTPLDVKSRPTDIAFVVKAKMPNRSLEVQGKTTDNTLKVKDKTSNTQLDVQIRHTDIVYEVKGEMPNKPLEVQGRTTDNSLDVKDRISNTPLAQSRPTAIAYEVEGEMPNKPLEVLGKNTDNMSEVKDKSSNTLDVQSRLAGIAFEMKSKMPNSPLEVQSRTTDNTFGVKDKTLYDPLETEIKKFYLLLQSEQNLDNTQILDNNVEHADQSEKHVYLNPEHVVHDTRQVENSKDTEHETCEKPVEHVKLGLKSVKEDGKHEEPDTKYVHLNTPHFTCNIRNSSLEVQGRNKDNTLELKCKTVEGKGKTSDNPLEIEKKKFYLMLQLDQNLDNIQILNDTVKPSNNSKKDPSLTPEHVDHETPQVENSMDTEHVKLDTKSVEHDIRHLEPDTKYNNINKTHFTCNITNSSLEVQDRNTDNTSELKCKTLERKDKALGDPMEIEIKKFYLMLQLDQNIDNIQILGDNVKRKDQGEKHLYLSPEHVDHDTTQVENCMDTEHVCCNQPVEPIKLDTKSVEQDSKLLEPDTKYVNLNMPHFTCNIRKSSLEVQGRNKDNALTLKCKTVDSSLEGKAKALEDPLEIELKKFYLLLQSEQNLDNVKLSDQSENHVYLSRRHVNHDTKQVKNSMDTEHETCSSVPEICSQEYSETANLNMEKQLTINTQKECCHLKTNFTSQRDFEAKHLNIQKCLTGNNDFIEEYESYGSETETYSQTTEDYLLTETKTVHFENTPTNKVDLHVKPIVQGQSPDLPVNPVVKGQGSDVHVKPIVKGQSSKVKTGYSNIPAAYLRVKPLNKSPVSDLKCRAWLNNRIEPCVTSEMIDNSKGEDLREVIKRARKVSFDMIQNDKQDGNEADIQDSDSYWPNLKMGPSINNSDSRNVVTYDGSDYGDRNVFACSSSDYGDQSAFTCSSSCYGEQNVLACSTSEFGQFSKSGESNNVGSLYHEYESVGKNYDSDDTIPATYPSYGIQSLCSDVNSSKICSQSLSKNRTQREYSDQQKNDEIYIDKYHEVSKTQNLKISVCQEAVSLKHSSDIGNCPDLGSSGYRDKIPSVSYSQGVAVDTSCKEGPIHHAVTDQPVYSTDLDQNKNEKVSYPTDVSSEECAAEEIIKSNLEKREYEELHLSSEESIALSENKIDTSSLSPELMEIILKKRTEMEKNFTKDCQVFVSVCEFLLSKDPGLTEQLQTCMQKCLEDISENFADAFQNFVQTTVGENETKH